MNDLDDFLTVVAFSFTFLFAGGFLWYLVFDLLQHIAN